MGVEYSAECPKCKHTFLIAFPKQVRKTVASISKKKQPKIIKEIKGTLQAVVKLAIFVGIGYFIYSILSSPK